MSSSSALVFSCCSLPLPSSRYVHRPLAMLAELCGLEPFLVRFRRPIGLLEPRDALYCLCSSDVCLAPDRASDRPSIRVVCGWSIIRLVRYCQCACAQVRGRAVDSVWRHDPVGGSPRPGRINHLDGAGVRAIACATCSALTAVQLLCYIMRRRVDAWNVFWNIFLYFHLQFDPRQHWRGHAP